MGEGVQLMISRIGNEKVLVVCVGKKIHSRLLYQLRFRYYYQDRILGVPHARFES